MLPCFCSRAADLTEARREFQSGHYAEAARLAQAALKENEETEDWGVLAVQSLMAQGHYPEALAVATNALASESRSIRLRWSARQAFLYNGQADAAARVTGEIQRLFASRSWLYREPADLIIFGRVALMDGTDPKMILDKLYDRIKKTNPKLEEVYLASGDLALDKHDYALAAKFFQEGLKAVEEKGTADLHYGLARAYAASDQKLMLSELETALTCNSNHIPSLLLLADHAIDAEDYPGAEEILDQVNAVNPWEPESWAYRAVIAHLENHSEAELKARQKALKFWASNPKIDYLIGLKLSQKYRFAPGASHQKRALAMDPDYLPSKIQLAQDLLRLGEEEEGWQLAEQVKQEDAYDVAANNLSELHTVIAGFQTLTNAHFRLRMPPREAAIYGSRALGLLDRARATLCDKYGAKLPDRVLVEMFGDEKDFAVRTFGMPDNDGFLGVCFGQVITANGPGSRPGRHFNWESMLWHEFCHVVTLNLTRNKMPRWLSEGISVYEERQANPSWGEHLNPRYREMLLGKDLTPVSQLSRAFLAPKTPVHLQFAYYESSLVVQFIFERFGPEKLKAVLHDLGEGVEINEALAQHTAPMFQLERDFETFARELARNMAPGLDWERPESMRLADSGLRFGRRLAPQDSPAPEKNSSPSSTQDTPEAHTSSGLPNFWVLTREADRLVEQKKWTEAKTLLEKLLQLYPDDTGSDSPYRDLAQVDRALGETNAETIVLENLARRDDEAVDAYQRLMQLATSRSDWADVLTNADRYLAVDPLVPAPYRLMARAAEASGQSAKAIGAYQNLLLLDPANPADIHFHLASLLHEQGDPRARRHVLQALEEAPRFRDALRLLRQMNQEQPKPQTTVSVGTEQ